MDFAHTPEQEALRQRIIAAVDGARLNDGLAERDAAGQFNHAGWRALAAHGLAGLLVPAQFGGGGADALTTAIALEALACACHDNGLNLALGAHLFGCVVPLLAFGSAAQHAAWLPALASGDALGALAVSEPTAGSDAFSLQTTATRRGDAYVLDGHKIYVTNGAPADLFVVLATVDRARGSQALTAFVLPRGSAGLHVGPPVAKMGLHTAAMSALRLEHCVLPAANRLGAEGSGLALFNHAMLWERGLLPAVAVGAMQRQLAAAVAYAQQREQFGRPIGRFQSVANRLVDMRLRWETAQLLLYRMAWRLDAGDAPHDSAALTKLAISEAWVANAQDALRIHAGQGYLGAGAAGSVERDLRDAYGSLLYSGTSDIQRQIVAQWMGVGGA